MKAIFIFALISLSSCALFIAPKFIKENFYICNSGEYTGLDSLINIQGYYSVNEFLTEDLKKKTDNNIHDSTSGFSFFFFLDGRVAIDPKYDRVKNRIESKEYHNEIKRNLEFLRGNYVVKNDTIHIQYIDIQKSYNGLPWRGYDIKISINKNNILSLELIKNFKNTPYFSNSDIIYKKNQKNIYSYSDFEFIYSEKLPDMNIPSRFKYLYECD